MPYLSENSLKQRLREGRICVVNSGKVYDVTEFADRHPGGSDLLQEHTGQDVSETMKQKNPHKHSKAAYKILNNYYIGDIDTSSAEGKSTSKRKLDLAVTDEDKELTYETVDSDQELERIIDWDQPIIEQLHKLKDRYFEWTHQPVDKKVRLFHSDISEFFSQSPWWGVPMIWIPILCIILWRSIENFQTGESKWPQCWGGGFTLTVYHLPLLIISGMLMWTLAEYIIHRWIFHVQPPSGYPSLLRLHFLLHGQHHKAPMDKMRLVFPPIPALLFALPMCTALSWVFPLAMLQGLISGLLAGYICYDLTHYYVHHGKPSTPYFKNLKKYHVKHHFTTQDLGFGISSKLWDYPFGTLIPESR